MKQFILKNKKAIAGISAALVIGVITMSFQDTPFSPVKDFTVNPIVIDSPPSKKNKPGRS